LRGYSAFTERHGDRVARELLTRYRLIVREAVAAFGGAEIRTEGDSFYVVFDSVSAAVEAALAIQAALAEPPDGEPIRAGIGVHAGDVEDDAEQGIVSSAVNIAARICAQAEPGEVLVSETVRLLTRTYLRVGFLRRGRRKLKGISEPVVVHRVEAAGTTRTRPKSRRMIAVAAGVVALVSLAGYGVVSGLGSEDDGDANGSGVAAASSSPGQSGAPFSAGVTPTIGSATPVRTIEIPSDAYYGGSSPIELSEGRYAFAALRPRVTFAVDRTGWHAYVDQVDAAALVLDDPSSPPGLQGVANIGFGSVQVVYSDPCDLAESSILDPTPNALIEWLQDHDLLTTSRPRPVSIGGYSGLEVEVSLSAGGCRGATQVDLFPGAGSRYFIATGDRLRVIAVSVPTRPLSILIQLNPDADEEVAARVERLLDSIQIDPS
jgi:hypothetical protein